MKKIYYCKCGIKTKGGRLCSKCSPYVEESHQDSRENPIFLLTTEISENNLKIRLNEGFALLQEY